MSAQVHSMIPDEWRKAAEETAKALSVARAIERKQYPDDEAPAGLLPALLQSVVLHRAVLKIEPQFWDISGKLQDIASIIGES